MPVEGKFRLIASLQSRLLRRLGLDVRVAEVTLASSLFFYFFLIGTVQFAGKTVRQSSFVDSLGSARLPFVYLVVALCALPVLRVYGRFADKVPLHRLMVGTTLVCSVTMVLFWWLYGQDQWTWVPFVYYVWISLATVLLVSQFWSYTNHLFDPRQARRLFGFVGAGGLLGMVAGGQVAARLATIWGTRTALLVGAFILVLAAALTLWIEAQTGRARARSGPSPPRLEDTRGGLEVILRSPHLQVLAALLCLSVMVAQIVDLQFNYAIEEARQGLDARTKIFGDVFSIMGVSAFFFQLLVTARIHRTLGVGFATRVLPVSMALGAILMLAGNPLAIIPMVGLVSGLRVTEAGLRYSLDQSTREILFVPVPARDRERAKAFIDVLGQRFARGAAALLLLTVTFGWISWRQASWFTLVIVVVWLAMTSAAHRHYVSSLRKGLDAAGATGYRKGRRLELLDPNDVTTLEVLIQSLGSTDPGQVLHSLELLEAHGRGRLVPPLLLYHDSADVRRRTLDLLVSEERRDAVPLIERLLGDSDLDVRAHAVRALAVLSGEAGPQMMRQRLDDPDLRVRSAAIGCLAAQGEEEDVKEAEAALVELLTDAEPTARAEGAKALSEIDEPRFQEYLVQLLYDSDIQVVKEAIGAVRRRVSRGGYTPLYVPILISLLRDRRLKHEAREALVACGEGVIPALVHFMNDPNELTWVRRGLPKTVARFDRSSAEKALISSLGSSDPFLRSKVIEALGSLGGVSAYAPEVEKQLISECRLYFVSLFDLLSLSDRDELRVVGPNVIWAEGHSPTLLQELLVNRMTNYLRNIFGLLALQAPRQDIWGAYQRLMGDRKDLRSRALEYLDNIVSATVRRPVLAVIDDVILEERVRTARRLYGLEVTDRVSTLRRLVESQPTGDADASWIAAAALQTIWAERVHELREVVHRATQSEDPLISETALWAQREPTSSRAELA